MGSVSKWDNRLILSLTKNQNEFNAILGSYNGVGSTYFLLTYKSEVGVRTKVNI